MKLIDYKDCELYRGTIFRFKGKYPFESIVDFMLMTYPNSDSGLALVCISGYCAGNVEVVLPAEARSANSLSVSTQWMVENWNRWVYLDCAVDEVFVLEAQVPIAFE